MQISLLHSPLMNGQYSSFFLVFTLVMPSRSPFQSFSGFKYLVSIFDAPETFTDSNLQPNHKTNESIQDNHQQHFNAHVVTPISLQFVFTPFIRQFVVFVIFIVRVVISHIDF
jgi:hypothetical protein